MQSKYTFIFNENKKKKDYYKKNMHIEFIGKKKWWKKIAWTASL